MKALRRIVFLIALGVAGSFSFKLMRELFIEPVQALFRVLNSPASVAKNPKGNLKSVAHFLQRDKRTFIQKPKMLDSGSDVVHPNLPFSPNWIASLESEDIKERLSQLESQDPRSLVEDLNNLILRIDISHIDEKQKLIQLSNYFERVHQFGVSQEVFFQEADLYFDSEDSNIAGYGRRALEYALTLEPIREKQEDERQRFYAAHPLSSLQDNDTVVGIEPVDNETVDIQTVGGSVDDTNRVPSQTTIEQ